MKFRFILSSFLLVISCFSSVHAQVKNVVIVAVYGGGSNAGAMYQYDFIELYNPTSSPQSLLNWSVQYSSAMSASWQKQTISVLIPAGGYFLVQLNGNAGAPTGAVLPTPDVIGTINLSATTGKVALVNVDVNLSGTGMGDSTVVDLVGYGGTASGYETMPAPGITAKKCLVRINNGCTDLNNNSTDFIATNSYVPHNTSSPISRCDGLPVKLISFDAFLVNDKVVLNWEAANQTGFNSFIVQKSSEGNVFHDLSKIKSNNPLSVNKYTYTEINPIADKEYFRLILVDNDGFKKYSGVVFVNGNIVISDKLRLYPNPVSNQLLVNCAKAGNTATATITNIEGNILLISRIQEGATEFSIDVSKLTSSIFYLVYENNGIKAVGKFVKR